MRDQYPGRPEYSIPMGMTIEREAAEFLKSICGKKNMGRTVSRILLEERARREERARIAQEVLTGKPTIHV
jgi:hypothetical protein